MAVAELVPETHPAPEVLADPVPDLRALVREYVRFSLFVHVPPGTTPPKLRFPLVGVGVEEEDVYAARPGAGDMRRPTTPDPDGSMRILPRSDPTGTAAVRVGSWVRYLQRQLAGGLIWTLVEYWTVRDCYERLRPSHKQFLLELSQHSPKRTALNHAMSIQAVRRVTNDGLDALVALIHQSLTTPRGLSRPK